MRVAALNPQIYVHKEFVDWPYFANLGTLHAAAQLREAGHDVRVADAFALPESRVMEDDGGFWMGADPEILVEYCAAGRPEAVVIGLSPFVGVWTEDRAFRSLLVEIERRLGGVPVILSDNYMGGMHYVDYRPEEVFSRYLIVSGVIKYEAEAWLDTAVRDSEHSKTGPRVYYGRASEVALETLPLPAWDLLDLANYYRFLDRVRSTVRRPTGPGWIHGKTLPMMMTRGCMYACVFCSANPDRRGVGGKAVEGDMPLRNRFRKYPLEYLRRQLESLSGRFGAEHLCILDSLANGDPDHFGHAIDLLNAFGVCYEFPNGLRADHLRRNQLERMKGRTPVLSISPESGSQRVVDRVIGKRQTLDSVEACASGAGELGIPLLAHYVIGFPGETGQEINETLRHAVHLATAYGAHPTIQYAAPLPGTSLESGCSKGGKVGEADGGPADYSLWFMSNPTPVNGWDPAALRRFKATFQMRLRASRTRKLIINATYRCNNFCAFCATGDRPGHHGDLRRYERILEKNARDGVRQLDLDGGEPTLYPHLIELIRSARAMGYTRVNVTTNGRRLIYEPFARELVNSGISTLLVSLHGHQPHIHEANTRTPGSFDQTVHGLTSALRLSPSGVDVGVNTTLTRLNAPFLVEFFDFLHGMGVRWANVQFMTPFGRAYKDIVPDQERTIESVRSVILKYRREMDIQVINLPPCLLGGDLADFATSDLYKHERVMIFANEEGRNLAEYLGEKREKKDDCAACPYDLLCEGFYVWAGDASGFAHGAPSTLSAPAR